LQGVPDRRAARHRVVQPLHVCRIGVGVQMHGGGAS
jgi:hypothetical protein